MYFLSAYKDNNMYVLECRNEFEDKAQVKVFSNHAAFKRCLSLFITGCKVSGQEYHWE